ncbi:hypothetical protein [Paraburkholderia fungorum]|uniref:hypothetical protein n=1 Tax=Paraburkholderia fungorum TaxID=134537 RepID=UPI001C1ED9FA|nr:hypothetical protein [Paraburkholderia fungorum]MBU7440911.1 hypothetical protein [Paraburkholderia fungorum]
MREEYKKFSEYLRKQPVAGACHLVWKSFSRVGELASSSDATQSNGEIYDWELELLAREVLLRCRQPFFVNEVIRTNFLPKSINHIREIKNRISAKSSNSHHAAMKTVFTLFHEQFQWQDEDFLAKAARYRKIFAHPLIREAVEEDLRMSLQSLYIMGIAIAGSLTHQMGVHWRDYYRLPEIPRDHVERFFELCAAERDELRSRIQAEQKYDKTWALTYNPLRGKPLFYSSERPQIVFGFSSKLLLWRITEGVYYDVEKSRSGFGKAFGTAFEHYIGDVLKTVFTAPAFHLMAETSYDVKKGHGRAGADWHISDDSCHVFIECKTKRIRLTAKTDMDHEHFAEDLRKMAEFVVQNYKNIHEARTGMRPDFPNRKLQFYNVVVTLENWRLSHPLIEPELQRLVVDEVARESLPPSLLSECPYRVISAQEFEMFSQDAARLGLASMFMKPEAVTRGPYRSLFHDEVFQLLPEDARPNVDN